MSRHKSQTAYLYAGNGQNRTHSTYPITCPTCHSWLWLTATTAPKHGSITVGRGAKIGAGSVAVRPVPAGAAVVGVPGRIPEPECPATGTDLNYANLPDPMLRVVSRLLDRQNRLEERLRSMQKALPGPGGEKLGAQMKREGEIREALRDVLDRV